MRIHPQLKNDCIVLGRFELSCILLVKDANYPWIILVPDIDDISEIYQMSVEQQRLLLQESSYLATKMVQHFKADKMNIAALGNVVPQLHLHHVARYADDVAWPAPIWGKHPAMPYDEKQLKTRIKELQTLLADKIILGELD